MTRLEELEATVAALPKAEMDEFADWFEGLRASQWDAQIAIDASSANLDEMAQSALVSHRTGQTTAF
jgi:hypothetical protein